MKKTSGRKLSSMLFLFSEKAERRFKCFCNLLLPRAFEFWKFVFLGESKTSYHERR